MALDHFGIFIIFLNCIQHTHTLFSHFDYLQLDNINRRPVLPIFLLSSFSFHGLWDHNSCMQFSKPHVAHTFLIALDQ